MLFLTVSFTLTAQNKKNVKSIDVVFKKERLIEVAFLSIKPDKQQQLKESYFIQVMPIVMEYGMKPFAKMEYNIHIPSLSILK